MNTRTFALTALLGLILAGAAGSTAIPDRIVVDGRFSEWDGLTPVYGFPGTTPGADPPLVTGVWIHADRDRLSLRLSLSSEVLLQGNSGLVLYIDTDGNPATGLPVDGLGADFSWVFAGREGRLRVMDAAVRILQGDVDLRQAPVMSATQFEVSLARGVSVAGAPFLPGSSFALAIRAESHGRVLSSTGRLEVVPTDSAPASSPAAGIPVKDPGHLRILTYNVLADGCFERPLPFRRILGAVDPDILSLQEISRHSVDETLEWVRRVLPGSEWHAAGFGRGVILSRFPVLEWGPIGTRRFWTRPRDAWS
jgi:hypothetical protein